MKKLFFLLILLYSVRNQAQTDLVNSGFAQADYMINSTRPDMFEFTHDGTYRFTITEVQTPEPEGGDSRTTIDLCLLGNASDLRFESISNASKPKIAAAVPVKNCITGIGDIQKGSEYRVKNIQAGAQIAAYMPGHFLLFRGPINGTDATWEKNGYKLTVRVIKEN